MSEEERFATQNLRDLQKSGRVSNLCRQWLVHEDAALANELQKAEFVSKHNQNVTERNVARCDVPLAHVMLSEEETRVQRERMRALEQLKVIAERDAVLAERLHTQQILNTDVEREITERTDEELARRLQEKEKKRYELLKREKELRRERRRIEREIQGQTPSSTVSETTGSTAEIQRSTENRQETALDLNDFYRPTDEYMTETMRLEQQQQQDRELALLLHEQERKRRGRSRRESEGERRERRAGSGERRKTESEERKKREMEERDAELARIIDEQERLRSRRYRRQRREQQQQDCRDLQDVQQQPEDRDLQGLQQQRQQTKQKDLQENPHPLPQQPNAHVAYNSSSSDGERNDYNVELGERNNSVHSSGQRNDNLWERNNSADSLHSPVSHYASRPLPKTPGSPVLPTRLPQGYNLSLMRALDQNFDTYAANAALNRMNINEQGNIGWEINVRMSDEIENSDRGTSNEIQSGGIRRSERQKSGHGNSGHRNRSTHGDNENSSNGSAAITDNMHRPLCTPSYEEAIGRHLGNDETTEMISNNNVFTAIDPHCINSKKSTRSRSTDKQLHTASSPHTDTQHSEPRVIPAEGGYCYLDDIKVRTGGAIVLDDDDEVGAVQGQRRGVGGGGLHRDHRRGSGKCKQQ